MRREARPHFAELDSYRGLAAMLVVVFHTYQFSRQATLAPRYLYEGTWLHHLFCNLEAGVAWFFALSGFLLFLPIATAAIRQTPRQSTRGFLVRRAIRIVPVYYVAILSVWIWRYSGGREQWLDLLRHLTFTHSLDSEHIFWTIGPAWSLAVEVHFYLLLALLAPVVHALCGRLATERARAVALSAGVLALGLAGVAYQGWAMFVAGISEARTSVYFSLPAKMDQFAVGMLAATVYAATGGRQLLSGPAATKVRIAGCAIVVALFAARPVSSAPHPVTPVDLYFHSISALAFGCFLAASVFGPARSAWGRFFVRPSLAYAGLISYGVYLWHEPILIELGRRGIWLDPAPAAFPYNAIALLALAIGAGTLSYRYIERPTMAWRRFFTADGRIVLPPLAPRPAPEPLPPGVSAFMASAEPDAIPRRSA